MGLFSSIGSVLGGIGGFLLGGPAGASLGAGLGGSLGGAADGSKTKKSNTTAINAATAAQTAGINAGIANNNYSTAQGQALFNPWITNGTNAVNAQGDLLGLNGGTKQQSSIDALRASPLYQSLFANGQNTLLANASATGGLRGGNTQNALANFGRDTLANTLLMQYQNLGGLSQQGITGAGAAATIGQANNANNTNLLVGNGQVQSSGILQNNANNLAGNNQIGSALGGIDIGSLLSSLGLGGGVGGGGFNQAGYDPSSIAGKLPF